MQRISSRMTFFTKRVFPMAWFGFLVVWVVAVVMSRGGSRPIPVEILLIPAVMVVFGYFIMKKLVFDLVDEVWDAGSELIVRNKTVELPRPSRGDHERQLHHVHQSAARHPVAAGEHASGQRDHVRPAGPFVPFVTEPDRG